MLTRLARAKLVVPTLLTVVGLAILIGLGTWQMSRRAWKDNILAKIKERSAAPPIVATSIWPGLPCHDLKDTGLADPCEYQPIVVRGVFDHSRERHIFTAAPRAPGVREGSGYWVFTPLKLDGTGRTVFVNRGYVPEARKDPAKRVLGQTTQSVEIAGVYRSAQVRAMFDATNDVAKNMYFVRSPAELWPASPDQPLEEMWAYVDQTGPEPAGGFPMPISGSIELSNRHLEYALTWYGLAGTLLAVYAAFAWTRLKAA